MNTTQAVVIAVTALLAFTHAFPSLNEDLSEIEGRQIQTRADEEYRLPTTLSPDTYTVILAPYIEEGNFTFDGFVHIVINVVQETNSIALHAKNLNISNIEVTLSDTTSVTVTDQSLNEVTDILTLTLDTNLTANSVITLGILYVGILSDDMTGFYRSSYTNAAGELKWIATTQFQPTYARQAFPCFDEPAFKAKFNILINRPEELHALSNMPIVNASEPSDGRITDVFDETPITSTYLLAFIVSDFENLTSSEGNFSVWARPNAIQQGEYALSIGAPILAYFTDVTGHDYPLPKMDMAALSDFDWGAMENWGLITYRETAMLYDEDHSSATAKARVATVVAHEIAHMWFGNIITLEWWDYAWLNEGFARRFQYLATDVVEPSWNLKHQFLVDQQQVVYANDALESAHALVSSVSTTSEITSHFSTISYNKGASIIRMIENIVGESVWHAALHEYIDANLYGNVEPDDLWEAIQEQVDISGIDFGGQTVKTVLDTWILKAGYPVISVNLNRSTGFAELSQERFLLRGTEDSVTNLIWWVPISFTTASNPDFNDTTINYWFGNETATIQVNNGSEDWVLFNLQENGYYRVNYDVQSWGKIIDLLNSEEFETIHVLNRAQIIDDLLNLARAGYVSYETALAATNYLTREGNYIPWKSLFTGLEYVSRRLLGQDDLYALYTTHVLNLIDNQYNNLGFDDVSGEDWLDTLNRRQILDWACNFGHEDCISKSLEYFAAFKQNTSNTVSPNQRTVVYCTAIKHGSSDDWNFLWDQYGLANVAAEQVVILQALGCSRNHTVLYNYLHYLLEEERGIRPQDMSTVYAAVYTYGGLIGVEATLDFIADYYTDVEDYYGSLSYVSSILSGASLRLSTQELIDKFELLIEEHSTNLSSIVSSLNSSLTLAKYELNWYNDNSPTIYNWLSEEYEEDTSATTDYRLPTNIVPETYEVFLTPYIVVQNFTFDGIVNIVANVVTDTDKVVLHTQEITWNEITVASNGTEIGIVNVTYSSTYHFLTIELNSTVTVGTVLDIHIEYWGYLNTEMRGFYRSSYINDEGDTKWLAATHLEPTGARKTFPCFDEPALKAKFTIHVNRPEDYNVLSNMPLNYSSSVVDGRVWDTFEQSVTMSTYLVAIIVSDFTSLTNETANFSVWARPNAIDQAAYALSIGPPLVTHMENLIDHEYQLPKLAMAALPDFRSGAMENWGLLTYRETRMLVDEEHTSAPDKQVIADVIAHEVTHQWFGNLVGPEWWNYLWLNEGFARYYQYHATAAVETTWGLESLFVVEQHQSAFATDSLTSTHAMSYDVWNPTQVRGIFDTISYAKAASVIRMMDKSFGTTLFHEALHDYLEARQYTYATPDHLWEAIQGQVDATGFTLDASVKTIMDTWAGQAGYPVLNVSIAAGIATLSQEKFILRNTVGASTEQTWWIPVTWTTQSDSQFSNTTPAYWLSTQNANITVNNGTDEWIIFNLQESGYYRVNYDDESWQRIISGLKAENFTTIHELNRASVIDDLLNLARMGYADYRTLLDATQYLTNETNFIPWKSAFTGLTYLNRRFAGTDYYELYKKHILTILDGVYESLGFSDVEGEDYYDTLLRRYVLSWACDFGHEGCISKSQELFAAWRANSSANIPVNQRTAVYCTAIRHGSSEDWEFLWAQYQESNVATEHIVILTALGCSENTTILNNYLNYGITDFAESGIRSQDSSTVFSSVYDASLIGAEYVLDFVEGNHARMYSYYLTTFGDYSTIASILSSVAVRFSTRELVDKFALFVENNSEELSSISSSLNSYLTLAKYELNWFEENSPTIIGWLTEVYETEDTSATTDYRLPLNIIPENYNLYLTPYLEEGNFTFDGIVNISANVATATDKVVLHTNEITWNNITITSNGTEIGIVNVSHSSTYHFLTIELESTISVGSVLAIYIEYQGILNDEMAGFYRSSYINASGDTRWLATTQLQSVSARRMFPCFDEPALRAKFIIHVNRPEDYHTISNMPLNYSSSAVDGRVWDTFEESVSMSTYLVAVIVSDFASLTNETANFSVWARPNAINQAAYALSVGPPLVTYLETAIGHDYQLPKLDMAAIPDFSAGAMENWGLLTYRETRMLVDEEHTSAPDKQVIANVIAHEVAHQWFGNLISPEWWNYLWLNEGFARYYQYHATAGVETSWGLESQFVVEQFQSVFTADSLTSTHAMNYDVYSPSQVSGIFDSISYAKAASVIRMMEKSFGTTLFNSALHDYVEARQYTYATPDHLWEAIQGQVDATGFTLDASVKTIMDTWAGQAGYPVLNVSIAAGIATLSQEKFILRNTVSASTEQTWWIPVTWTTQSDSQFSNTTPAYWLSTQNANITVNNGTDEWIIFNLQESGYYRVNYDDDSWQRIISGLKSENLTTIHELNRASIIDDLFNLARMGYANHKTLLDATQYLENETNYIPWRSAFNGLTYLNRRFAGTEFDALYKKHILTILDGIYESLGFSDVEGEDYYDTLLRRYVLSWACDFGHEGCISKSQELFAAWRANSSTSIPVNQRTAVYCTAIRHGSSEDWEFLWSQYQESNVATEHIVILTALGCSENTTILHEYLNYGISEFAVSGIRAQDSTTVFSSVYGAGLVGAEYVLDFVESHYDTMYSYYGSYSSIASILSGVGTRLSTQTLVDKFELFIENNNEGLSSITSSLNSYLTLAKYELNWFNENSPAIIEWLSETYDEEDINTTSDYRLPTNIVPESYDIYLTPYLEVDNFIFSGEVYIIMNVVNETSQIVLHTYELTIEQIAVYVNVVDSVTVSGQSYNSLTQKLTLSFDSVFSAGTSITVYFAYAGILNDEMKGFYRSSYKAADGTTHWIATTQFQPTHARRAFPCFDEPSFKAKFTVHIETPNNYHSISNMPLDQSVTSETANRTWDSFEQTVTMSSYLVAFIVSDYESIENESGNFSIWARANAIEHAAYSLTIGPQILDFLGTYTDVSYSLSKMDMAAIPDFSAGAMENWGLVTYREYGLLANDNVTSATYKRYINTIIAHELVHMWFGNLVTCEWWDYTWLNEGFAQYYQYVAGDAVEPEWNLLQQFVVYGLQSAMETDASASIHAMNNNVSSPSEISSGFDTIAYQKAASVIRMMQHTFGPTTFANALHNYLEENQYSTSHPDKLWAALQVQVDQDNALGELNQTVKTIMDSWATQSGYPVINASLSSGVVTLTQERFLLTRTESSVIDYTFWIPVTYTTESDLDFESTSPKLWFGGSSASINLGTNDEWFILNVQEVGYYRVNYDQLSWSRIIATLQSSEFENIHELNRAQIIDDLLNLARSGYVEYSLALDATLYLGQELNHLPWRSFFNGLAFLNRRFEGQTSKQLLDNYVLKILDYIYEQTGLSDVDGEGQLNELNRQLIVNSACSYGHADCIEQAQTLFSNWRNDNSQWILPNLRPAVYCTALKYGTYEDWQFLWEQYETTNFASEQVVILTALGCTTNATTVQEYLSLAIATDDDRIRKQDRSSVFSAVYGAGAFGVEQTLDFIITNTNSMYEYYGDWSSVASIFSTVANRLSTEEQIATLEAFVTNNPGLTAENLTGLASYVTSAKANLAWYQANSPAIIAWLEAQNETTTTTTVAATEAPTEAPTVAPTEAPTEIPTTEDPNSRGVTLSINIISITILSILTFSFSCTF